MEWTCNPPLYKHLKKRRRIFKKTSFVRREMNSGNGENVMVAFQEILVQSEAPKNRIIAKEPKFRPNISSL
jgi:hypothetical protein